MGSDPLRGQTPLSYRTRQLYYHRRDFPPLKSPRTKLRRLPKRGAHDRETIDAILDEAKVCHLGFVHDGRPAVIPTLHARAGDDVLIHGSSASRALRALAGG